jgi:hypothetical protein
LSNADICSHIIVNKYDCIEVYDFYSHELIKTINIQPLSILYNMSVSKCYKYIIGSDESQLCIWNIEDSTLIQNISVEFNPIYNPERDGPNRFIGSQTNGEPIHTFTIDNKLLVASYNKIKKYINLYNLWMEETIYELTSESHIVCISANVSNANMFACGDIHGDIYIFNDSQMIYSFTTRVLMMRSDHLPEITSIAFNNNILVVSSIGTNNILLNLETMTRIRIEEPVLEYRYSYFNIKNYLITPCMKYFIGTFNNKSYMWDALTGKIIKELPVLLEDITYTPQCVNIVSYGNKYGIRVYNRIVWY